MRTPHRSGAESSQRPSPEARFQLRNARLGGPSGIRLPLGPKRGHPPCGCFRAVGRVCLAVAEAASLTKRG